MENDWKKRLGIVYSTNPEFQFDPGEAGEAEITPPGQQVLYVSRDRKQRGGKTVTLVEGFTGRHEDLVHLARELKTSCGSGGSVKEGNILIQGDFRERVLSILTGKGYRVKTKGG
jgi:translation initiation factor 1